MGRQGGFKLDSSFLLAVIFLLGLGLVQVYSSSYLFAVETYNDGLFFFRKQLVFVILGLGVILTVAALPAHWARRLGWCIWAAAVVGVALTLVPGVGVKVGGATRWLRLPLGFRLEPGEFLRVTFPFVVSWAVTQPLGVRHRVQWMAFRWALVLVPAGLLIQQPDFGSMVLMGLIGFTIVFVNGLSWRWVFALGTVATAGAAALVINAPYRVARVKAFLDPWADPAEKGFQLIQSMLSFHAGGLWGQGVGQGQGKLFFLPEAHTDFTLAVLAEESGFWGFSAVLLLFGFIVYRGFQTSVRLSDERSRLISLGITSALAFSVFVNVGVVTGMLPTKGLTLPFLSYGGSSLIANCLIMGWLLNFMRQAGSGRSPLRIGQS